MRAGAAGGGKVTDARNASLPREGRADGLAGVGGFEELAVFHDEDAVDEDVVDAGAGEGGLFVGGVVENFFGVKEDEVGVGAGAEAAFVFHRRDAGFEAAGGGEGEFLEGLQEGEGAGFADVAAEDSRRGPGVARVADDAVAGDHGEGVGEGFADEILGVGMNDDHAAGRAVAGEGLGGKAFAGGGPLEVGVVDAGALLPAGVEDGGFNIGHAGGVGVAFDGDVEAAGVGVADELEDARGGAIRGALDVGDVDGRAGDGCSGDEFREGGEGIFRAGFAFGAHVDVARGAVARGDAEGFEDFPLRGAGSVLDAEADGGRAALEAGFDEAQEVGELGGGSVVGGGAGGSAGDEDGRLAHGGNATGDMADADAVVDRGRAGAAGVPRVEVGGADFEFENGGVAVAGFEAVIGGVLAVLVEVDEAGGEGESADVEGGAAGEGFGGNGGDAAVADADMARGVEAGFGIKDAGVEEDKVVVLGRREKREEHQEEMNHERDEPGNGSRVEPRKTRKTRKARKQRAEAWWLAIQITHPPSDNPRFHQPFSFRAFRFFRGSDCSFSDERRVCRRACRIGRSQTASDTTRRWANRFRSFVFGAVVPFVACRAGCFHTAALPDFRHPPPRRAALPASTPCVRGTGRAGDREFHGDDLKRFCGGGQRW